MRDLLTSLQGLSSLLICVIAATIVAGETAVIFGLLVPGEATLLLVGFLAYADTLRLVPALLVMIIAAVMADTLAFRSGRRPGPRTRPPSGFRPGTRSPAASGRTLAWLVSRDARRPLAEAAWTARRRA